MNADKVYVKKNASIAIGECVLVLGYTHTHTHTYLYTHIYGRSQVPIYLYCVADEWLENCDFLSSCLHQAFCVQNTRVCFVVAIFIYTVDIHSTYIHTYIYQSIITNIMNTNSEFHYSWKQIIFAIKI